MASPQNVVFTMYNASTGAPLAGLTPTFATYKNDLGADVTPPAITEIGGGGYKFTPVFPTDRGIYYAIAATTGVLPPAPDYIAAEDYNEDLIPQLTGSPWDANRLDHVAPNTMGDVMRLLFLVLAGHVKIDPTVGTLTVYSEDATTVFQFQNLTKAGGAIAGLDALERGPATRPGGGD